MPVSGVPDCTTNKNADSTLPPVEPNDVVAGVEAEARVPAVGAMLRAPPPGVLLLRLPPLLRRPPPLSPLAGSQRKAAKQLTRTWQL